MQLLKESLQVYQNNISRIIGRSIISVVLFFICLLLLYSTIALALAFISFPPFPLLHFFPERSYASIFSDGIAQLSIILAVIVCSPILLGIYQAIIASVSKEDQHHSLIVYYRGKQRVRNIISAGIYFGVIIALWASYHTPDTDIPFLNVTWNPVSSLLDILRTQNLYMNIIMLALIFLPILLLSTMVSMTPFILADIKAKGASTNPYLSSVKLLKGKYLQLFLLRVGVVLLWGAMILGGYASVGFIGERYGEIPTISARVTYGLIAFVAMLLIVPLYLIAHGLIYRDVRPKHVPSRQDRSVVQSDSRTEPEDVLKDEVLMTPRRWKEVKIPMLIGLVGEGLTLAVLTVALISNAFDIAFGGLDSETVMFTSLAGVIVLFIVLVLLRFFISHIRHYRTLIVEGAPSQTASKVFRFYVAYGGAVTAFVIILAIPIGIPYIVIGILGLSAVKRKG